MTFAARIEGIGLVGPGLCGWSAGRDALSGRVSYAAAPTIIPAPEALPATERRRAGKAVRLALAAGSEAARAAERSPSELVAVFASSSGDGENCHAICETLASDDRLISPTRFHNSVHNAPAGYWSIAAAATGPVDCLGAFDASFGAGLLEALGRLATDPTRAVLLVAYDAPYPEPLHTARPLPDAFAVALVLCATDSGSKGIALRVDFASEAATRLEDGALEAMRRSIPAARALPLLACLAVPEGGEVRLDYLEGLALQARVGA